MLRFWFSIAIIFIVGHPLIAASFFEKELSCYHKLRHYSYGDFYDFNQQTVLIPDSNRSAQGFLLINSTNAYFCDLPEQPTESTTNSRNYFLKIKVEKAATVYAVYSESKGRASRPPAVSSSNSPAAGYESKYIAPVCKTLSVEQARNELIEDLKKKVVTTKMTFDKADEQMYIRHNRSEPTTKYLEALNTCSLVEGEVGRLAKDELKKFSTPSPFSTEIHDATQPE